MGASLYGLLKGNWISTDRAKPGTKCRRCGTWWPNQAGGTGKGKGFGRPTNKNMANQQWLESPPGLSKMKPLKRSKVQQEATELLSTSWASLPEETQTKLQAFGIGPSKPEEPELKDLLKTHMDALPQQVQQTCLLYTSPSPRDA